MEANPFRPGETPQQVLGRLFRALAKAPPDVQDQFKELGNLVTVDGQQVRRYSGRHRRKMEELLAPYCD